jgi:hypothetical protein
VAKIVLEVPETLKTLEGPLNALVGEAARRVSDASRGHQIDYELFERRLRDRCGAVERTIHGVTLAALDIDAERVIIDDIEHVRVGKYSAQFRTQSGEVAVERGLFRPVGERNAPTVDLVALRAGAMGDGWLPGAARGMAFLLQQGTSREAQTTAQQLGRLPYSRCSFERVGHLVGELFSGRRVDVEETLIRAYRVAREATGVSVSVDRVNIPMEEPKQRGPGRPKKDGPKRSIQRVWRQGYVGTVTLHDDKGEAIHTLRYGRMPDADEDCMVEAMASDVLALRQQRPELTVTQLADGAAEMWNLLGRHFDEESFGAMRLSVDFWHLVEKLSSAAKVIDSAHARACTQRWRMSLLNSDHAALDILGELRASGQEWTAVGEGHPVHEAITYLENAHERMKYASARRAGLPIGSGNVEATCKSLVNARMKRSGSRWKHETGEHVIELRALALSDRWDAAMDLTLRPARTHARAA